MALELLGVGVDSVCGDLVFTGSGLEPDLCVLVGEGRIAGFSEEARGRRLDYRGRGSVVLPGFADMHVHLRGLELSYKEDEYTGTAAAAVGGVVAVADMPNTKPPLREPGALRLKLERLSRLSVVDYAVYAGVPYDSRHAWRLASEPVIGFKVYPEDLESRALPRVLEAAGDRGLLVVLHPEHPWLMPGADYSYERDVYRGCESEEYAVEVMEELVESLGSPPRVHVTHASCSGTVVRAKRAGFTVDVAPHHLAASRELARTHGWCLSKVNPPLRGETERARLYSLVLEGLVDAVASDHAPHAAEEKYWRPPYSCSPGFPWLEWWPGLLLRMLWRVSPRAVVDLGSRRPAEILGVEWWPIEEGSQATFSVFSLDASRIAGPRYSKAAYTPFHLEEYNPCLATVIRGVPVMIEGVVASGVLGANLARARRVGGGPEA